MENLFSSKLTTHFQQRVLPEEGYLVGYAALIDSYRLAVPLPDILSCIGLKHRRYIKEDWQVFTPRHQPDNSLWGHLTFALVKVDINSHFEGA